MSEGIVNHIIYACTPYCMRGGGCMLMLLLRLEDIRLLGIEKGHSSIGQICSVRARAMRACICAVSTDNNKKHV